jgi:hypothetical protein
MFLFFHLLLLPVVASIIISTPNFELTNATLSAEDFSMTYSHGLKLMDESNKFLKNLLETVSITFETVFLRYSKKSNFQYLRLNSKKMSNKKWRMELKLVIVKDLKNRHVTRSLEVKFKDVFDEIFGCEFKSIREEYFGKFFILKKSNESLSYIDSNYNFGLFKTAKGFLIIGKQSKFNYNQEDPQNFSFECASGFNFICYTLAKIIFILILITATISIIFEKYCKINVNSNFNS